MKRARARFPVITAALAAVILAVYTVELAGDGMGLCYRFGLTPAHPTLGTALSASFVHDPANLRHVGGNVLVLALFGAIIEGELGHVRVVVLFALGGIGAAAFQVLANPGSMVTEVGASGPIFALVAAAAMLNPRLLGFAVTFAASNIWETITGTGGDVAVASHIGGFVTGFMLMAIVFRRRLAEVRGWRPSRRAGHFATV